MHDPQVLKRASEAFWQELGRRGYANQSNELQRLAEHLNRLQQDEQQLRQQRRQIAKQGGREDSARRQGAEVAERLKELSGQLKAAEADWYRFVQQLPNVPDADVPDGGGADRVLRTYDHEGREQPADWRPEPVSNPQTHDELAQRNGWYDAEQAAKMSGARFAILAGPLARLHRALGQFFLDTQVSRGYREYWLPWLLQPHALEGIGQLPKFAEDLFKAGEGHYLLSTGEAPLMNLFAGRILDERDLPILSTTLSPCFRSEAGSYGRDTKGLIRQHQFEKVELVRLVQADQSEAALLEMVEDARAPLLALGLPHRVALLAADDMAFAAARTLDIEVWMTGQQQWREIASCSNCRAFQTRRLKIRYRPKVQGKSAAKPELLHSLNASGLPLGRTLAALLEYAVDSNHQVQVPECLSAYMGGAHVLDFSSGGPDQGLR
ncbi:MAG: serine--tRNA ligase [Gammaproteobacteria bacterium]